MFVELDKVPRSRRVAVGALLLCGLASLWTGCGTSSGDPGARGDTGVRNSDPGPGTGDAGADLGSPVDSGESDTSVDRSDTTSVDDTGPRLDTPADASRIPNRCSETYRELINGSGPEPKVERIPWKMVAGGSPSYRKKTAIAVWRGTRQLDTTVQFDCPPTAESNGLKCSTDRGLVLEHATGATARTMVFAVSIPVDRIDFPEPGTEVRLTFFSGDSFGSLQLREVEDREPILVVRAAEGDMNDDGERLNPERFVNEYGLFDVSMQANIDRADSAHCVATDHCGRVLRVEPLTIDGDETRTISPGTAERFTVSEIPHRFWHLVSFRRNQALGSDSSCPDVTYPAASYAFARMK